MSPALQELRNALKAARIAVHERAIAVHQSAIAELRLDEPGADVIALSRAEEAECLTARDLYRAVEELPAERRPKGWYAS
jgi:hypothetical protein